jgi:hypothetical protein
VAVSPKWGWRTEEEEERIDKLRVVSFSTVDGEEEQCLDFHVIQINKSSKTMIKLILSITQCYTKIFDLITILLANCNCAMIVTVC